MIAEAGGHRVQRVPRTEKRGRVHSSTITVAVVEGGSTARQTPFDRRSEGDLDIQFFSGTGPGGQNRNKVQASCRLRHVPTGLVRTAQTRSRETSLKMAKEALWAELDRLRADAAGRTLNGLRRAQTGTGERSDKRRTWRFQEDRVVDHATGRTATCSKLLDGRFELLWA